jgi:hypothetical protein
MHFVRYNPVDRDIKAVAEIAGMEPEEVMHLSVREIVAIARERDIWLELDWLEIERIAVN